MCLFFICMLFVQITTKYFPGSTLLAYFIWRRPFGWSLTHDDYQILAAMTSNFLQVGINGFDGSDQRCRKYPIVLKYIKKKNVAASFTFYCYAKHSDILWGSSHVYYYLFPYTARLYTISAWTLQHYNQRATLWSFLQVDAFLLTVVSAAIITCDTNKSTQSLTRMYHHTTT